MENDQEKTMIFIDGQNIFCGALDNRLRINYERIRNYFQNQYNVIHIGYYSAFDENNHGQQGFFHRIASLGFTLRKKPLRIHNNGTVVIREEKKIDVWLATELIKFAHENEYDRALVFSGDTDFIPAYEYLHELGKRIGIWTWKNRGSDELRNFSNEHYNVSLDFLDDIIDSITF